MSATVCSRDGVTSAGGALGALLGVAGAVVIQRLAEWPTALSPLMLLVALLMMSSLHNQHYKNRKFQLLEGRLASLEKIVVQPGARVPTGAVLAIVREATPAPGPVPVSSRKPEKYG